MKKIKSLNNFILIFLIGCCFTPSISSGKKTDTKGPVEPSRISSHRYNLRTVQPSRISSHLYDDLITRNHLKTTDNTQQGNQKREEKTSPDHEIAFLDQLENGEKNNLKIEMSKVIKDLGETKNHLQKKTNEINNLQKKLQLKTEENQDFEKITQEFLNYNNELINGLKKIILSQDENTEDLQKKYQAIFNDHNQLINKLKEKTNKINALEEKIEILQKNNDAYLLGAMDRLQAYLDDSKKSQRELTILNDQLHQKNNDVINQNAKLIIKNKSLIEEKLLLKQENEEMEEKVKNFTKQMNTAIEQILAKLKDKPSS